MAAPYTGRYASIRLTTGTTTVEMLGKWDITIAFDDIDASVFGTVWKANMNGMQGWTGKFDGFFAAATSAGSSGQYTLQAAALAQTKLQNIRFYLNSTGDGGSTEYFFMPNYSTDISTYSTDNGAYISNVSVSQVKDGLASVSYDIQGYGGLALYFNTSSQAKVY
jgi:hypothetical protein